MDEAILITILLLCCIVLLDDDTDIEWSVVALCTTAANAHPMLATVISNLGNYVLTCKQKVTYGTGEAKELYSQYAANPTLFKSLTNFTPSQFEQLMNVLLDSNRPASYLLKPRDVQGSRPLNRQRTTNGGRPHKLDPRTRVFLCLVRLKDDDRLVRLCAMSGLNIASICEDFWHVVECLLVATEDAIQWPDPAARRALSSNSMRGVGRDMAAVGIIDGTAQYIRRPGADEPLFYNGRKKRHFLNHLVVCDWRGRILAVRTGFTGKTHDGVAYRACDLYTQRRRFFAAGQTLLADNGFESCGLITPMKKQRGQAMSSNNRAYNRLVRRYRVVIEFLFGAMKIKFGMISGVWRHSLPRANMIFMLCCQLMNYYMRVNRKYIRGDRFSLNEMAMEAWEEAVLRGTGNDWEQSDRDSVRAFFQSPEGRRLIAGF
ncbi:hypothetical protein Vretimale_15449 [Volvox reticuliferus]|uniref:DDE Tnp4 domain-containing protein n=2 Tax=Volvox reticuliferus TaxID=1737510 RepID=A0A8J4D3J8_9CHLO|nr:hypothetical protein Vretifemale_20428 [Volvox reticuliferus]GIM12065.1 hypothetical protein Vretimale_15449 [Volvox reticuliferus]